MSPGNSTILIIDDELRSTETLKRTLDEEFNILVAQNTVEAESLLEQHAVQVILCDQRMPGETGVAFLSRVRENWPDVIRMIISGFTDPGDLVDAINDAGIYQYISKPWHPRELLLKMRNAVELFHLQRQNAMLAAEVKKQPGVLADSLKQKRASLRERFDGIESIVRSGHSSMEDICKLIQQVAPFDVNVLISGESGTGKELCARAIHYNSLRADGPFVAENCGAMPDELLESELFGHKRGAFTGASENRSGLFELADGGTVFLDEVGEISPAFQIKLLRVLQEGEIRPLGSNHHRYVDVRVIAATNLDLEREVNEGRFREDLYYRLATFTMELPPLRERRSDIPVLAQALLQDLSRQLGKPVETISRETLACLTAWHWPGNVRELQNELKRALVLAPDNELTANLLSPRIMQGAARDALPDLTMISQTSGNLKERIEAMEACIIRETLIRNRWNKTRTADELGLSRVGLRSKLERYELERIEGSTELGSPEVRR